MHLVCYGVILTEPIHDFLFSRFDNMTSSFHVTSGLDKSSMETRVNDKTRPRIHAMRAARQGSPHRGRIPLTSLERLVDIWPQTGDIFYSLALNSEDETRIMIDLAWHATVTLRCERCLGSMSILLSIHSALEALETDAQPSDENQDLWLLDRGCIQIDQLLQEEILLNLPLIARHEPPCDIVTETLEPIHGRSPRNPGESNHPFQILADTAFRKT